MKLEHRALLLITACSLALPAWPVDDQAEQRNRIAAERRAAEQHYQGQASACASRFAVAACIEQAKAERRSTLDVLRRQEILLDDAQRKARAAERLRSIANKRVQAESRPPAPGPAVQAPRASAPPVARAASAHGPVDDEPARRAEAARRVSQAKARQQAASKERETIARRQSERKAQGKKVDPLPPASAPQR
jgi:hypothetical protein